MSIVGPRPEDPRYVALYTKEQQRILNVRPGITSPASIEYRSEEALLPEEDWETYYIQYVMPVKLELDLDYVKRANLIFDVSLIVRTIVSLSRRR